MCTCIYVNMCMYLYVFVCMCMCIVNFMNVYISPSAISAHVNISIHHTFAGRRGRSPWIGPRKPRAPLLAELAALELEASPGEPWLHHAAPGLGIRSQ